MSVDRSLSVLNLYDIQANLIPGVYFVLLVFVLVYPWSCILDVLSEASVAFAVYALILGIVSGRFIQAVGRSLDDCFGRGIEEEFERRITVLEEKQSDCTVKEGEEMGKEEVSDEEKDEDGDSNPGVPKRSVKSRLFDYLLIFCRDESEEDDSEWVLNNPATEHFLLACKQEFEVEGDLSDNDSLLFLLLSYFDTHGIGKAMRFQALHSFHRSILASSLLALGVAALVGIGKIYIATNASTDFSLGPPFFWLGLISGLLLLSSYICNQRKNKFEDIFVRYVFLDFHQDQVTKRGRQA